MRTYKRSTPCPPVPLDLTDDEAIEVVRIVRALGGIKDVNRRIEIAAIAMKIGVIEPDNPEFGPLRVACGLV